MERPVARFISTLSGAIGLISFFIPESLISGNVKWIIGSLCINGCLACFIYELRMDLKNCRKSYSELEKRHQELAKQFDRKSKLVEEYQTAFSNFGWYLRMALMLENDDKQLQLLQNLFLIFLYIQNEIDGER